jgi:hypothetical protein
VALNLQNDCQMLRMMPCSEICFLTEWHCAGWMSNWRQASTVSGGGSLREKAAARKHSTVIWKGEATTTGCLSIPCPRCPPSLPSVDRHSQACSLPPSPPSLSLSAISLLSLSDVSPRRCATRRNIDKYFVIVHILCKASGTL